MFQVRLVAVSMCTIGWRSLPSILRYNPLPHSTTPLEDTKSRRYFFGRIIARKRNSSFLEPFWRDKRLHVDNCHFIDLFYRFFYVAFCIFHIDDESKLVLSVKLSRRLFCDIRIFQHDSNLFPRHLSPIASIVQVSLSLIHISEPTRLLSISYA